MDTSRLTCGNTQLVTLAGVGLTCTRSERQEIHVFVWWVLAAGYQAVAALQQRPHRSHNHSRQRGKRPHGHHNHSRAAECTLDPFSHPHIPTFLRTFFLSSSYVSVCQLQAPLSLVHTSVWVRQRKWSIQEVWNFSSDFNQQFISAIMSVSFMSSVSSIIHHSSFSTLSIHQEFISSLSIHHHSSYILLLSACNIALHMTSVSVHHHSSSSAASLHKLLSIFTALLTVMQRQFQCMHGMLRCVRFIGQTRTRLIGQTTAAKRVTVLWDTCVDPEVDR